LEELMPQDQFTERLLHPHSPEDLLYAQLSVIADPRRQKSVIYPLRDVLFIALCAMLSGAEAFTEFQDFGDTREDWLKERMDLENGPPSHDTFRNVFALVAPEQFNQFFIRWTQGLCKHEGAEVIAIDGKSLRGSSKTQAVHLVNAWACENNLILGQLKTDKKSNEITAIPALLKQLAIKGSIITIDAMGTQKEIAREVDDAGASYVFSLKKNHPKLFKEVCNLMDKPGGEQESDYFESTETGHGRSEVRRHWITADIGSLIHGEEWAGLCSVGKIQRVRKVQGEESTTEEHYYLCSIEADASLLATCARKHWEVENKLHWTLDVTFGEDACQVREDTAATNLSLLRKMALNVLRHDKSKGSMRAKRKRAGWNVGFLEEILGFTHA